jgi:hypothetical protein
MSAPLPDRNPARPLLEHASRTGSPPLLLLRHTPLSRPPFLPFSSLPRQEATEQIFFPRLSPVTPSCPLPSKPPTSPHYLDPDLPLLSTGVHPPLPESDRSLPPPLPSPHHGERCPLHVFPSSNPLLSFPSFVSCCRTGGGGGLDDDHWRSPSVMEPRRPCHLRCSLAIPSLPEVLIACWCLWAL